MKLEQIKWETKDNEPHIEIHLSSNDYKEYGQSKTTVNKANVTIIVKNKPTLWQHFKKLWESK